MENNTFVPDWNDFINYTFPELDLGTKTDHVFPAADEDQPDSHIEETTDWTHDTKPLNTLDEAHDLDNTTNAEEQRLGWINESSATVFSPVDRNLTLPELISDMQLLEQTWVSAKKKDF